MCGDERDCAASEKGRVGEYRECGEIVCRDEELTAGERFLEGEAGGGVEREERKKE
jgi:hypothetical protein